MATDQRNLPAFFNTDADFQSWCQGIHAQLAAAGLVNTADTGQINNATVTKPAAINTSQGYEIWRFADSLQASAPIYLKIEYGSAAVADRPSLWITAGPSTNGAGTLTGVPITTRRQASSNGSKTAGVVLPSYCSGDGSRLALMTNYDSASATFEVGLFVDRLRDSGGTSLSEGYSVVTASAAQSGSADTVLGNTTSGVSAALTFTGIGPTGSTVWGAGVSASAGNVAVMPPIVLNGRPRFLSTWVTYANADIVGGTAFSATVLGASHTYMPLPSTSLSLFTGTNSRMAMIWE